MKRHVFIAAILLLGGAVMNVAAAWGCAMLSPHSPAGMVVVNFFGPDPPEPDQSQRQWWAKHRPHHFPDGTEGVLDVGVLIPGVSEVILVRGLSFGGSEWDAFRHRAGLPARSLEAREWSSLRDGWEKEEGWLSLVGYRVPLYPIWPGFAVNTLFYAVVVALLCLVVRTGYVVVFRYLTRSRRGLCPKCAYPMGESAVCSECGKTLPTSRASRRIIV